jgi:hypothetical protein
MIRIAFAVFIGTFLAGGSAIAACANNQPSNSHAKQHPPKAQSTSDYCLDLNAVPQISANVVATEPAPAVKQPSYSLPTSGPYEGPTLGVTKPDPGMKLPAPTIGYHWQLQ